MWQDFSAHHAQRGDVTAIVWGSPGALPPVEHQSAAASAPPSDTADTATAAAAAAVAAAAAAVAAAAAAAPGVASAGGAAAVVSAAGGNEFPSSASRWKVDAEALTRGRRAGTPFVQQCDLIFPLPDRRLERVDGAGPGVEDGAGNALGEAKAHAEAERQAEAFVTRALGSSFFYRVRGTLCDLLREPFLSSYVLKGSFSALALNAPSDQGNSFAVLPGGTLVLSLDRESFQTLGLPGEAAPIRPKGKCKRAGAGAGSTGGSVGVLGGGAGGPDRYVSVIDLSSKAFRPGKPLHDRVLACLGGGGKKGDDGSDANSATTAAAAAVGGAAAVATPGRGVGVVDMVVCWWGGGRSGERRGARAGGDGAGDALGMKPKEERGAAKNGDGKGSAADGCEGGRKQTGRSGQQEEEEQTQKGRWWEEEGGEEGGRRERCREVTFPPHFSVEKVDLVPDICFFREACCPDLDLVGQGLATSPPPPPTKPREEKEPGDAKREQQGGSTNNCDNPTRSAADAGRPLDQSRPPPPPPPSSTKCLLALDLFEWLGAVSCGLNARLRREPSPPEPYLSEFETPRHLRYQRPRTMCRARLRGLLPPLAVGRCIVAAGEAAAGAAVAVAAEGVEDSYCGSRAGRLGSGQANGEQTDGCSWGSVTVWPFRDAPRAYAGADAPCGGGGRARRRSGGGSGGSRGGGGGGRSGVDGRTAREWPVGGHGIYTVVACPGETAVAYVSARCPGPGW